MDLGAVQGHSSPEITAAVYDHSDLEDYRADVERAEGVAGSADSHAAASRRGELAAAPEREAALGRDLGAWLRGQRQVERARYAAGEGQTAFKIAAEYAIIAVLSAATLLLWRRRGRFDPQVHRLLLGSLLAAIACEFAFTLYVSNFGVFNEAGHYLKLLSYFLVHRAVTET